MNERQACTSTISVIMLNHNGMRLQGTIQRCVLSLRQQSAEAEIVLVDDSSTDDSPALLQSLAQEYNALYVSTLGGGTGVGAARNAGIHAASGDLLAFIDNDAVPCAGWLEAVQACMIQHPQAGACASKVLFMDRPEMVNSMGSLLNLQFQGTNAGLNQMEAFCAEPAEVMYPTGCGMVLRRAALDEVGLFDEGFINWGADDADMGLRLRRAGWDIVLASEARIHHIHNASHVRFWDTRNRIRMALKYLYWLELPWFMLRDLRYNVSLHTLFEHIRAWFSCIFRFKGLGGLLSYRWANRKRGLFRREFARFLFSGQRLSMVPDNRSFGANTAPLTTFAVGQGEENLLYHGWYWVEKYLGRQTRFAIEDASLRGSLREPVEGLAFELVSPRNAAQQQMTVLIRHVGQEGFCIRETFVVDPLPRWYHVSGHLELGDYEIILKSAVAVYGHEPFPRRYGVGLLGLRLGSE